MKLTQQQIQEIEGKFAQECYEILENITYQGKDLKYALRIPETYDHKLKCKIGGAVVFGITNQTYQENKEEIEKAIAKAKKIREEEKAKRIREERKNIHIYRYAYDWESGTEIYVLSSRVSTEEWEKIRPYMYFIDTTCDTDCEWDRRYIGWGVKKKDIEKVEEILNIKPELRYKNRRENDK